MTDSLEINEFHENACNGLEMHEMSEIQAKRQVGNICFPTAGLAIGEFHGNEMSRNA